MNVPNQRTLDGKSIQELSKLAFEKVQWHENDVWTLGITINNGESVKSGTSYDFTKSHTFDQSKKITKIVTTVDGYENRIAQIKFFSGEELLVNVGCSDVGEKMCGGREVA